jgi:TrmH family RNA methyltransferase
MEPGLSHRNRRVAEAARLHRVEERRSRRQTLLEGPHLLAEAIEVGATLVEIFALAEDADSRRQARSAEVELVVVGEEALRRLSSTRSPQSPVAVIQIPSDRLDVTRSLLVAWQISDPGNLGTMIRTAAAFGLDVAVTAGSVDPWSPKVLRAASGGHFQTGLAAVDDLSTLDAIKVAAVPSGGAAPGSLPDGRLALLIGSESRGLPDEVIAGADACVTIPMAGRTESLNAAVAAAILAYEVSMRSG